MFLQNIIKQAVLRYCTLSKDVKTKAQKFLPLLQKHLNILDYYEIVKLRMLDKKIIAKSYHFPGYLYVYG